jgi:hypothetical protein
MAMIGRVRILASAAATFALLGATALADEDIVWPTYVVVAKPHDASLSCPQLHTVIDKVAADIKLLDKAQRQAEDAVRTTYDTQSSSGREVDGVLLNTATTKWGFRYTAAREQIMASRKLAEARQAYLNGLVLGCKNPPQSGVAPAR